MLEFTHDLWNDKKLKFDTDAIYFDYSKAFDKMDDGILAKKLAKISCPFNMYKLILNYVINREYSLFVDGTDTKIIINPLTGVPHGSHCGPLLFIFYINDLKDTLDVRYKINADDIKIYQLISND